MNSLSAFHSRFLRCAQFLFRDWQLLNPGLKEGKEEREGEGGREVRSLRRCDYPRVKLITYGRVARTMANFIQLKGY